jgi:excinuclease UvrABC nuclease subunit
MLPINKLEFLPKTSGIYRVLDADRNVIYVGQARNIHSRWNNGHHKLAEIIAKYGIDVYIDWVVIPEWLLNRAENASFSFYLPNLNSKTPPVI